MGAVAALQWVLGDEEAQAYAAGTSVTVEKTKSEIDSLLGKHGATQRGVLADDSAGRAIVAFVIAESGKTVAVALEAQMVQVLQGAQPRLLPEAT
jgi:hypothetical protein